MSFVILLLAHTAIREAFFIFSVLVSFQTFSLYLSPQYLEHFLAHSALPLDIVLPKRADFAIKLEINLVSLETDTDITYSAVHIINEEQVTLLLCCGSTCFSLTKEYDNENSN